VAEIAPKILIVEDDPDVAEMLDAYFNVLGYEVNTVYLGEEAVSVCRTNRPDLIILDIRLPDIDGYEVASRLRSNRRTDDIPIIFLTEKRARPDRLRGLELGADDYITKPFDFQELRLRARNALRRSGQGPLTNPITNLAGNALIEERLRECLEKENWTALLIKLQNLSVFRDKYGFVASDDVLRAIGLMIQNAIRDLGSQGDFIGQYSQTEFLLITKPSFSANLLERIQSRLEQSLDYFYPLKDRADLNPKDKLGIYIHQLYGNQGPFEDLAILKSELRREH